MLNTDITLCYRTANIERNGERASEKWRIPNQEDTKSNCAIGMVVLTSLPLPPPSFPFYALHAWVCWKDFLTFEQFLFLVYIPRFGLTCMLFVYLWASDHFFPVFSLTSSAHSTSCYLYYTRHHIPCLHPIRFSYASLLQSYLFTSHPSQIF